MCGLRPRERDGLAADTDFPRIGPDTTTHDLDQGRLSGAVFADKGMNLAGAGGEGRFCQRRDTAIGFTDIDRFDSGCRHDQLAAGRLMISF